MVCCLDLMRHKLLHSYAHTRAHSDQTAQEGYPFPSCQSLVKKVVVLRTVVLSGVFDSNVHHKVQVLPLVVFVSDVVLEARPKAAKPSQQASSQRKTAAATDQASAGLVR